MATGIPLNKSKSTPDEFVIIVGGPSNTFNGYQYSADEAPTSPADSSSTSVKGYTRKQNQHGKPPETHDRYWANFIYSAVKLVETGQIRPERGDVLTFLVYMPAYYLRDNIDWLASPFNPSHQYNAWVKGKRPFDPRVPPADAAPSQGSVPESLGTPDREAPATMAAYPRDSNIVNLTIFMMEIYAPGWPNGGFPREMRSPSEHMTKVLEVPRRLALGSRYFGGVLPDGVLDNIPPALRHVQIRMLFLDDDLTKLYTYLTNGSWKGPRWHDWMLDGGTEESSTAQPQFFTTYKPSAPPDATDATKSTQRLDSISMTQDPATPGTPGLGATWAAYIPPEIKGMVATDDASIDRSKIKIKRLDYFGHSGTRRAGEDALYLRWGWANVKGEPPWAEVYVTMTALKEAIAGSAKGIFATDSLVKLWGCFLAHDAGEESMASTLSKFASQASGVNSYMGYAPIIDPLHPNAMPAPSGGTWLNFMHP